LLMNLLQNPIAFQAALTNRLLSLDNKTNAWTNSNNNSYNSAMSHGNNDTNFNESNGNDMELSPKSSRSQHLADCYMNEVPSTNSNNSHQTNGCGKMKTNRSSKTCLHKRRNSTVIKIKQGKF
jgi:hypothetical protein